jgi:hypothetical protein
MKPKNIEFNIEFTDLPWKLQRDERAPLNVPIIVRTPNGTMRIHFGRELLERTQWITLKEFNEFIQRITGISS